MDIKNLISETMINLCKKDPVNPTEFKVTDLNREALNWLYNYLANNLSRVEMNQGVMLMGSVGSGKTRLIECLQECMRILWNKELSVFTSLQIKEGYYAENETDDYSLKYKLHHYRFIAINDIGLEMKYKTGNDIIQTILFERYEKRLITHCTTNLNMLDIFKRYDDKYSRMTDRFNTMFKYIEMNDKSFRV